MNEWIVSPYVCMRRAPDRAVVVGHVVRLDGRLRAPPDGLGERKIRVLHQQRDVSHAVAVLADVLAAGCSGSSGVVSTKRILFCAARTKRPPGSPVSSPL